MHLPFFRLFFLSACILNFCIFLKVTISSHISRKPVSSWNKSHAGQFGRTCVREECGAVVVHLLRNSQRVQNISDELFSHVHQLATAVEKWPSLSSM